MLNTRAEYRLPEPIAAEIASTGSQVGTAKGITGGFSHPSPCPLPVGERVQRTVIPFAVLGGGVRGAHVVIVDEELPYPANSGKRIRTWNLTVRLRARHRITYVAHRAADPMETRRAVAFLQSCGIEPVLVDRPLPAKSGPLFYGRLLWNLRSPLPYSVEAHNSASMRRAIRRYAESHAVDLWQCEWTPYAESVRGAVSGRWIAVAHNVESLIWQRYHKTERNWLKRWYIAEQWRKFERFERRVFSEAARVIAVSDQDAALARQRLGDPRVSVVDNGVERRALPARRFAARPAERALPGEPGLESQPRRGPAPPRPDLP